MTMESPFCAFQKRPHDSAARQPVEEGAAKGAAVALVEVQQQALQGTSYPR